MWEYKLHKFAELSRERGFRYLRQKNPPGQFGSRILKLIAIVISDTLKPLYMIDHSYIYKIQVLNSSIS